MPNDLEKKVIAALQGDIPVSRRPYMEIAEMIGVDEDTVLSVLKDLYQRGVIRRFGATLRHQKSGFNANAMVAWQVDESLIDAVGEQVAGYDAVTHCYRRDPAPDWPYNLYTMVHAQDEAQCRQIARKISKDTGISEYTMLFSRRELKKTSMQYFDNEFGDLS
ncbi:MAG TPA: Lrp/AsnC family transcriptional regulator [Desulfosalsimonadaceae bacterium]|nr:Lrp/AsnC family transcriptional regulator [Desulfosalsimonadaceae bacterium]